MFIDGIEIEGLRTSDGPARVSFVSGSARVHITAMAVQAGRAGLVADALRQLRRMPEFRAGRVPLTFAPGVLPAGCAA